MIGEIIAAINDEFNLLFEGTGTTILTDMNFTEENIPVYNMPCIILKMTSSPEYETNIGGVTNASFNWSVYIYTYCPNTDSTPDQDYAYTLLNILDTVRKHFALKNFKSTKMKSLVENNSFNLKIAGVQPTKKLDDESGFVAGFVANYGGVAIDKTTSFIVDSPTTLLQVIEIKV